MNAAAAVLDDAFDLILDAGDDDDTYLRLLAPPVVWRLVIVATKPGLRCAVVFWGSLRNRLSASCVYGPQGHWRIRVRFIDRLQGMITCCAAWSSPSSDRLGTSAWRVCASVRR
ncbi:hypothetical protein PsYK624_119940 [Phanerochaete sordida]|uniref:Uncharacterized protein n=1 Tax=Phanerochaete sordida TaxID=48140 RepID=A0A9P3GJ93_9APHY|nr:hypothetical protein PsYK624_119940 [Phanerochaete sordida]